jgi:hypothetical protein
MKVRSAAFFSFIWMLLAPGTSLNAFIVYVSDQAFAISNEVDGAFEDVVMADANRAFRFRFVEGEWSIGTDASRSSHEAVFRDDAPENLSSEFEIDNGLNWMDILRGPGVGTLANLDGGGNFFENEGFVGVRMFVDDPLPHYGWVRISHSADDSLLTVHDWAWNSTPGEPILAGEIPEPAAYAVFFGLVVLGFVLVRRSVGVKAWRR